MNDADFICGVSSRIKKDFRALHGLGFFLQSIHQSAPVSDESPVFFAFLVLSDAGSAEIFS
jgi:hypothetical protein